MSRDSQPDERHNERRYERREGSSWNDRRDRSQEDENRNRRGRQRSPSRVRGEKNYSSQAPSQRRRVSDSPRNVAFDVLCDVDVKDAYANLVLPSRLARAGLSGRDAGFATELAYGTLRMRGKYDAILAACVDRPLSALDNSVVNALRLGCHQLLAMRVPPHAAVSQTVALVRERVGAGPGQLVNAVLRKVSAKSSDEWDEELGADIEDDIERLAVLESHPTWVVRALRGALVAHGRESSEVSSLLTADNEAATVMLVARPPLSTPQEILDEVPGTLAAQYSPLGVASPSVAPRNIGLIRNGSAGVQDEGSQLVALALANTPIDGDDERWLDMCAGPGGKSALLAMLAAQRGARLVANEVSEHRTRLVQDNLQAVPAASVEAVRTGDGREIGADEPGAYDRILVDAPCTGLGALRRRPEARWRKEPRDVPALAALQRELLASALDAVRPGGVVAYVTCSPHHAETILPVDDVLAKRDDVQLIDAVPVMQDVAVNPIELGEGPRVQLWPHVHHTDAMHLALLRRLG